MPSFAIEAAGEAVPLTADDLYHTLSSAVSQDQVQIQASAKQLQTWETSPNYYAALQEVFLQRTLPTQVRLLALITLKNGVDKYWRKSANNAVRQDERERIRGRLLQASIEEENAQLASMNAIIIAKIARHDFPKPWETLLTSLASALRESPTEHLSRVLAVVHQVLKELVTVRLGQSRSSLHRAVPEVFTILVRLYLASVQRWEELVSRGSVDAAGARQAARELDLGNQVLRIIRRALLAGYEKLHDAPEVVEFWALTKSQLTKQLNLLMTHPDLGRQIILLSKIHVAIATQRPISFALLDSPQALLVQYFTTAVQFRQRQLEVPPNTPEIEAIYETFEAFNLRTMLLIRACFRMAYGSSLSTSLSTRKDPDSSKAKELIKDQVLNQDFIGEVFGALRNLFFIMQESDVEEWITEAEEWEMKEEGDEDLYDRSVRPAAERVFHDVTIHYKSSVAQPIMDSLAAALASPSGDARLLDAALTSITIGAPVLQGRLDFNTLLSQTIVEEVRKPRRSAHIVRRRIAIMLAKWSSIDVAEGNKALVYQIYRFLLDPASNELAVRIAAGKHLKDVVDEWGFNPDAFAPEGHDIIRFLISLISETSLPETKMALLSSLGSVVERMEVRMAPLANQIISMLPSLWEEASSENLMMQRIVELLAKLISAMKTASAPLHPLVLPIIRDALQPGSNMQLYLLEDSLDLLKQVVAQTVGPATSDLLSLVPALLPILDTDTESVEVALDILEDFLLLEPAQIIADTPVRQQLIAHLTPCVYAKKSRRAHVGARCFELIIRAAESMHGTSGVAAISSEISLPLSSSDSPALLQKALGSIEASWESRQTTGPNKKELPSDWRNETDYFIILARLIICGQPNVVSELLPNENSQSHLLDEWFAHMDQVTDPLRGKLLCMALTKLLGTGTSLVLSKLQDYMALWTSMVVELHDDQADDKFNDSLADYYNKAQPDPAAYEIPKNFREAKVGATDLVRTVRLADWISHYLKGAIEQCGGAQVFNAEWLDNVDKDIVKDFVDKTGIS